jgi:hypothetical protein
MVTRRIPDPKIGGSIPSGVNFYTPKEYKKTHKHLCSQPEHDESSDSLVVMTSALHAEGREFNPRSEHVLSKSKFLFLKAIKKWAQWGLNP